MELHEYAVAFPKMDASEFAVLVESIRRDGYDKNQPVVLYQGKVLDGRHRAAACDEIGIDPETREFDGDDSAARAFAWRANAIRRDLSDDQKARAWCRLFPPDDARGGKRKGAGRKKKGSQVELVTEIKTADATLINPDKAGVSKDAINRMRKVQAVAFDVFSCDAKIPINTRLRLSKLPPPKRREALKRIVAGEKHATVLRDVSRKAAREANAEQEILGKYSLIYADPPWQYSNTGLVGAAEDHYPTTSTEDICKMPVKDRVTDNAILLMWVTNPMLADGLQVVESWGFKYRTQYVWVKDRATPAGFHVRSRTEMLWVCTRGTGMTLPPEKLPDNVINAPVRAHSEKPTILYDMIEMLYPDTKKLEMFCRKPREGWDAFGNQI